MNMLGTALVTHLDLAPSSTTAFRSSPVRFSQSWPWRVLASFGDGPTVPNTDAIGCSADRCDSDACYCSPHQPSINSPSDINLRRFPGKSLDGYLCLNMNFNSMHALISFACQFNTAQLKKRSKRPRTACMATYSSRLTIKSILTGGQSQLFTCRPDRADIYGFNRSHLILAYSYLQLFTATYSLSTAILQFYDIYGFTCSYL
jgi:hypothetical protein